MADITKRLRYFNGQFLEEKDFSDEQEYHLDRFRRHNRLLHTYGIAEGLEVTAVVGAGEVTVGVGTALDNQGRMIVLATGESLSLNAFANKTVLVVISYDQTGVDPATVGNQGQATRWEERPKVQLVDESAAPSEGTHIRLARVEVSGDRTVSTFDDSVRQRAGVRVGGELALPRLKISSEERPDEDWPEITSDAERRVRLDDHLAVGGNLSAGTISTTGSLSAATITASGNVTAASLSTSGNLTVAGITASGNVSGANLSTAGAVTAGSLSTTGNLTVAGITASGNISGASISTSGMVTAGGFTTTGALSAGSITTTGALTAGSITATSGLSFPSLDLSGNLTVNGTIKGNLAANMIQPVHITDAAVTTDKLADYAVTTNEIAPFAVNNSKLSYGAVSLDKLDSEMRTLTFSRRGIATVSFAENENGSKSVTLGFRARLIIVSGFAQAPMSGQYNGGPTNGFVDASSEDLDQWCWGAKVQRLTSIPYFQRISAAAKGACAYGYLSDMTFTPVRQVDISLRVESVNDTGLMVRITREVTRDQAVLLTATIEVQLLCLGN